MKIKAAVVREIDQLTIEEVELAEPKAGEVLVRMRAAGVCHSDLHTYKGELRSTPPIVLGHEGAGIVEAVGPGVTKVQPGDAVGINWLPACNSCPTCLAGRPNLCERFPSTTFRSLMPDGTTRHRTLDGMALKPYLSSATMAEYAVIHQDGIVPLPPGIPFEVAAITGCAVMTGVGAVLNTAQVQPGSSAAVIGCGGVGLSAIQGCRLAGCYPIIAVDVMESKLAFARELGATHTVHARETDVVEALRELTRLGPDYVFDSVGAAPTIAQALQSVRPGGTAVIMGLHATKIEVPISPAVLVLANKRLLGSFAGSARPLVDLPKLLQLYQGGRLELDRLITKRYPLEELPQAFADMEGGAIARGVLVFP
ncbi:Zn-dependent alcohol dehydrogenase [Litorilinea aerophila]|uniref:Zn-dependent alcohol dehydrogenase n=1 Tax=Litorilinea aerophila TaxID=1204385 RepID=A0A540VH03_9CHLR|nr:Zn-dependent alcohol dehydrogenase [Litorilinea aerophila]MCC9076435.1 Zn-dependent alcohol dehydrogenase [Litorilinea aerophila]